MFEVDDYQNADGKDPYFGWLNGLNERIAKARIAVRVQRMAAGNFGDCKPIQDGVWELRIDHGPGYLGVLRTGWQTIGFALTGR